MRTGSMPFQHGSVRDLPESLFPNPSSVFDYEIYVGGIDSPYFSHYSTLLSKRTLLTSSS